MSNFVPDVIGKEYRHKGRDIWNFRIDKYGVYVHRSCPDLSYDEEEGLIQMWGFYKLFEWI